MKTAFGPKTLSNSPLLSKDESTILKNTDSIQARWAEYFSDLFYNPSVVDDDVIKSLPRRNVIPEMSTIPLIYEVRSALEKINPGKAPGLDGIPIEVLVNGGDKLLSEINSLICNVWEGAAVPQNWIYAILISFYKGKGLKNVCGNYRWISLLEAVGKVFSKVLMNRLLKYICPVAIPDTQCGFCSGRGTTDMNFSAWQIQEKAIEQRVKLYQVFVDLTKAFDNGNCPSHWLPSLLTLSKLFILT